MGAEEAKPKKPAQDNLSSQLKQFRFIKKMPSSDVYGEGQLYQKMDTKEYVQNQFHPQIISFLKRLLFLIPFKGGMEFSQIIKISLARSGCSIKDRIKCVDQVIFSLKFYQKKENISKIYYPYFELSLRDDIAARRQNNVGYTEAEIWYIFYSIISPCAYLQSINRVHCDIRPSTILFSQNGQPKILPYGSVPRDQSGYQKAFNKGSNVYLSPELLSGLQAKELIPQVNYIKSDVYSLGLTMLECMSMQGQFYDFETMTLNESGIKSCLLSAFERYPEILVKIIGGLLYKNVDLRPDFLELNQLLSPYQNQIRGLQPFQIQKQEVLQQSGYEFTLNNQWGAQSQTQQIQMNQQSQSKVQFSQTVSKYYQNPQSSSNNWLLIDQQ